MSEAVNRGLPFLRSFSSGLMRSPVVRFGTGVVGKVFSLPAMVAYEELFKPNPWGDKNSAMYGKGPGSLEYVAALERANAAGRDQPIEEDYLATPPVEGSTFTPTATTAPVIDLTTNQQANETAKGLEKYGFDENFALTAKDDGTYGVVRSEAGKKVDAFLDAKAAWLAKTANSPAARAGFDPDVRWQLHLKNQDFQEAKRTGTLDEFALKYPNSQTAKRLNWDPRHGRRF